jgi:hypothetical protein
MSSAQGRAHLLAQCGKFGFFKSSFRNFIRFISRIIHWKRQLAVGQEVFDGEVYDLKGNKLMIKEDYLDKIEKVITHLLSLLRPLTRNTIQDIPIILNFGSYS